MALPSSRNTTYAIGSDIRSADLNAIQDCIIGKKHGTIIVFVSPFRIPMVGGSSISVSPPYYVPGAALTNMINLSDILSPGTKVYNIDILHYSGGAGTNNYRLAKQDHITGAVVDWDATWKVTGHDPAPDTTVIVTTITGTAKVVAAGEVLYFEYVNHHAADRIYGIELTIARE